MAASLRGAINAKCKSCVYDPLAAGNWRMQVDGCAVTRCPLHEVRPRSASERLIAAPIRARNPAPVAA